MATAPDLLTAERAGGFRPLADAADEAPPADPGDAATPPLGATIRSVIADAGGLLRAEASLVRLETQSNLRQVAAAAYRMGIGGALLFLALIFLAVAAVVALAQAIGLTWALLAIGGLCLLAGGLLMAAGRRSLSSARLMPEQALGRMSRDLDRLAARAEHRPAGAGEKHHG